MTKDKALQMAIDYLGGSYEAHKVRKACQEALEQPTEPRLVSYAPDGSTCTLNIDGEEVYFNCEQPTQRNFCERCGKRASKDPYHIHTCTPPQALKEKNE